MRDARRLDRAVEHLTCLGHPALHPERRPEQRDPQDQKSWPWPVARATPSPRSRCFTPRLLEAVQVELSARELTDGVEPAGELVVGHRVDKALPPRRDARSRLGLPLRTRRRAWNARRRQRPPHIERFARRASRATSSAPARRTRAASPSYSPVSAVDVALSSIMSAAVWGEQASSGRLAERALEACVCVAEPAQELLDTRARKKQPNSNLQGDRLWGRDPLCARGASLRASPRSGRWRRARGRARRSSSIRSGVSAHRLRAAGEAPSRTSASHPRACAGSPSHAGLLQDRDRRRISP